jgi:hypothetical protein
MGNACYFPDNTSTLVDMIVVIGQQGDSWESETDMIGGHDEHLIDSSAEDRMEGCVFVGKEDKRNVLEVDSFGVWRIPDQMTLHTPFS